MPILIKQLQDIIRDLPVAGTTGSQMQELWLERVYQQAYSMIMSSTGIYSQSCFHSHCE